MRNPPTAARGFRERLTQPPRRTRLAQPDKPSFARIGVEGTSGNHTARKTLLELRLMNAALDAIKERYGSEGFHLVGQSGGSKLVGGLIGLRHDVACAVSGSGPLATPGSPRITDRGRTFFDVTQSIPLIAQNLSLRLLLVTDPADKKVPIAQQTGFVDKMRQAGCQIPQFFVEATDEDHHGVVIYSQLVAAGCVLGKTDGQIARGQHDRQADRRVPSTMSEDGWKPMPDRASRQPVPDSRAAPGGA
jgi:hypothetical protein